VKYDPAEMRAQLIRHEAMATLMYEDSEGIPTIGVGHNLQRPIPEPLLLALLDYDIHEAETDVRDLCRLYDISFDNLTEQRQMVLLDMSFNLGKTRLSGFRKMWAALHKHDYDTAGDEMLDSRWAKQVGKRAGDLAIMMRAG
jgi:lysozyme